MSGKHTAAGQDRHEPGALAPEDLEQARELAEAALAWQALTPLIWDNEGNARTREAQDWPRGSYHEDLECHDEDGSGHIRPWPLTDSRIASMVEAATEHLDPDYDELRTAVEAVTRAVCDEAARRVAERYPDEAVEVEYALWGTPTLRYDGTDQEQAALYEKGIPEDSLLDAAVRSTPGGTIAAANIRTQRTAAAAQAELATLDHDRANTLPGHTSAADPGLAEDEIAQIRALQAASFPTGPGTHQLHRAGTPDGTDASAVRAVLSPTAERGHGR